MKKVILYVSLSFVGPFLVMMGRLNKVTPSKFMEQSFLRSK